MESTVITSAPLIGREVLRHIQPGWTRGESGVDKTAFFGENGDVVICFYDTDRLSVFRKWIDFCKAHQGMYLPRYLGRPRKGRIGRDTTPVYMVRMEPLTPVPSHLTRMLREIDEVQYDINKDKKLRSASDFQHLIRLVAIHTDSRIAVSRLETAAKWLDVRFPGFLTTYLEAARACPSEAKVDSLTGHDGARNVMMRGGTPVIIDPWF